jgi:hypothetical protein
MNSEKMAEAMLAGLLLSDEAMRVARYLRHAANNTDGLSKEMQEQMLRSAESLRAAVGTYFDATERAARSE